MELGSVLKEPGMAGDVKSIVASWDHCQTFKPSQRKEPLVTTPLPDLPWQRIGVDLCQLSVMSISSWLIISQGGLRYST